MKFYKIARSFSIGYLFLFSLDIQSSNFSDPNRPLLQIPKTPSTHRFSPSPTGELSSGSPVFIESPRNNFDQSNLSIIASLSQENILSAENLPATRTPSPRLSTMLSQSPTINPMHLPKKKKDQADPMSKTNKDLLYMGCASVITIIATQTPKVTGLLLQKFEGSRSNPSRFGALLASNALLSILPTVISIGSLSYGLHKLNQWIYGDVFAMLAEEKAARERGDQEIQGKINEAIITTRQARGQLNEVITTLGDFKSKKVESESKLNALSNLITNLVNQVQALRHYYEIQDIDFDSHKAINDVKVGHDQEDEEESKENETPNETKKSKGLANLPHSAVKKYTHLREYIFGR